MQFERFMQKLLGNIFGPSRTPLAFVGSLSLLVACSKGSGAKPMCASTKSLLRFDTPVAPTLISNSDYYSNGGFIEVYTRKEILGPVDSFRTCTAYVEFTNSPAENNPALLNENVSMNVYTASHCLDLSKDYLMKLYIFDSSSRTYYPVMVQNKALEKMQELRQSMKRKGLSKANQEKILKSFRINSANLEELFNQPTTSSATTGTGGSTLAGQKCLKKDDPNYQVVCSTYQDMIHFKVEPAASSPAAVIDVLKEIRRVSNTRLLGWIRGSKLYKKMTDTNFKVYFADDKDNLLDAVALHKSVRSRLQNFSRFKLLQFVHDELLSDVNQCAQRSDGVCAVKNELSGVIQAALADTKYQSFDGSTLSSVVDALKSEYTASMLKMDATFTALEQLVTTNSDGSRFIPFEGRIHSNFRFVTASDPTTDVPDPRDTVRAFMHFNLNNLTGDVSGSRVAFIYWNKNTVNGFFNVMEISRTITDLMKQKAAEKEAEINKPVRAQVGFLQAGDSGSIIVVDHLPFFAVTSVDGVSTSGGATIRPLPEPMEEESIKTDKLCN